MRLIHTGPHLSGVRAAIREQLESGRRWAAENRTKRGYSAADMGGHGSKGMTRYQVRKLRRDAIDKRVADAAIERGRINLIRRFHGLIPLSIGRVTGTGMLDNRSLNGVCVKCDADMVLRADGRYRWCPYCVLSPAKAAKARERDKLADARMNAPVDHSRFAVIVRRPQEFTHYKAA